MILELLQECRTKAKQAGIQFSLPVPNDHPTLGRYVSFMIQPDKADDIEALLNQYGCIYERDNDNQFMTFFSVQEKGE